MTEYTGYELHPEAYVDIDEIRGYIAADIETVPFCLCACPLTCGVVVFNQGQ